MALTQDATAILIRLGFTQLEADIYTFLLINGATTGYGVGKGVSKPVANVYKAIDSLLMKGAIEQTSGDKKKCIAIPWQQLIKNQQRQFDADIDVLKQAFNNFPKPSSDEAVYQIKNIEQLKDSSVELINSATKILLADVEPQLIEPLREHLISASQRGVEVVVKVYEPIELPGITVVLRNNGAQVYGKTADRRLSLCADGKAMIVAMISLDLNRVIQAFKTKSALMSLTVYNQLLYEFVLTQLKDAVPKGDMVRAQAILKQTEHLHPFSAENKVFSTYRDTYASSR